MAGKTGKLVAFSAVVFAAALILAGCQPGIGWLVNAFAPPRNIKAIFQIPPEKKILVFVDDMINPVSEIAIKSELTKRLNRKLVANEVAADIVPYEQLLEVMSSTSNFNRLSIGEIGKEVSADIVLYVGIDEFALREEEGVPLWRGKLFTSLRVVDVEKGRLWPIDRAWGYQVDPVDTPGTANASPSYGLEVTRALAEKASDKIAKLFYDHKVSAQKAVWEENRQPNW